MDHISGILSFLCLRQSTKGDTEKALSIYYPEGDRSIEILKSTADTMLGTYLKYKLDWIPMSVGDKILLKKDRFLKCYQADHGTENPMIFTISEQRKRLKQDLHGTDGKTLATMGDEEKYDYHEAIILAYSGDSMPVDPDIYKDAAILIHECTFLKASDRKWPIHSEVQEVFNLARDANVKRLILTHISPRYFLNRIEKLVQQVNTHDIPYDIIMPEQVNEIN